MTERSCICCGMPLRNEADHPNGDLSTDYCVHCAREDGSQKSYDEVFQGFSAFVQRTQGVAPEVAAETVAAVMARLPAWQTR